MPASLNKVFLIGNLTRDPELRYVPSGQAVTSFTVALNRTYILQSGEKKEETSFVRVVTWARRAEVCNEFLKKGSSVFVEGRIQSRSWEANDGSKRSTIEVVANNVQFLGKPSGARNQKSEGQQQRDNEISDNSFPSSKDSSITISDDEMSPDEKVPF